MKVVLNILECNNDDIDEDKDKDSEQEDKTYNLDRIILRQRLLTSAPLCSANDAKNVVFQFAQFGSPDRNGRLCGTIVLTAKKKTMMAGHQQPKCRVAVWNQNI